MIPLAERLVVQVDVSLTLIWRDPPRSTEEAGLREQIQRLMQEAATKWGETVEIWSLGVLARADLVQREVEQEGMGEQKPEESGQP